MKAGELLRRVKLFVQHDRMTRELEEEMRLHVEMRAEQIGPEAAQRRFGNTTASQQQSRDAWGFVRLQELAADIRFAVRRLTQRPGFAVAVVTVMAIGIGATTAIFSAVDAVLLRPLPFHQPDKLVLLPEIRIPFYNRPTDHADWTVMIADVQHMSETFSHVAVYGAGGLNLWGDGAAQRVNVGAVSTDFFETIAISAIKGRVFSAEDGQPGGPNVAILSYALWQGKYGGRDISGLRVKLNLREFEVVGVMPRAFNFPEESELWVPMTLPNSSANFEAFGRSLSQTVIARIRDDVSFDAAMTRVTTQRSRALATRAAALKEPSDGIMADLHRTGIIIPLKDALAKERSLVLLIVLGATGVLLLIACVNVTNLLLAHAAERTREIAVRQVMGATRARIVQQLLTESVLLSLAGALFGLLLSPIALRGAGALVPQALAGIAVMELDWRVLTFSITLAFTCGIAFGILPALGNSSKDTSSRIRSGGGHGATAARSGRLRRALVGAELALTVVLLIGAGILLRSLQQITDRASGMATPHVGTLSIAFPGLGGSTVTRLRIVNGVIDKLLHTPGFQSVGAVDYLPNTTAVKRGATNIDVVGVNNDSLGPAGARVITKLATSGYFQALGIRLVEGRLFTDSDSANVAIVTALMAKTYWPDRTAVGQTFMLPHHTMPTQVIGVVADVPHQLDGDLDREMYLPLVANLPYVATIVALGTLPDGQLLQRMQQAVRAVEPSQAVFNARMMEDVRAASVAPRKTSTLFIAAFAVLALGLASVGVYAVVSFSVSQRSRELGIRSALGATGANLARMISGEMAWVVTIGIGVGLAAAWVFARLLERLAYGIDIHDAMTFGLIPIALLVPTALATLIPARRALRLNPADVMRADG
ncbi:MAG: ABC transporter permease [Gemmatimonas sp.]